MPKPPQTILKENGGGLQKDGVVGLFPSAARHPVAIASLQMNSLGNSDQRLRRGWPGTRALVTLGHWDIVR